MSRRMAFLLSSLFSTLAIMTGPSEARTTGARDDSETAEDHPGKQKRPGKQERIEVRHKRTEPDGVGRMTPGGGLLPHQTAPRAQSGLTRDFIARQSPTLSPTALIADLPGVIYASNDPLGTNDDQQGLSVRGLDQTEIGYLFEGIPAAPPLFLMPYTSATADNENIASVTLAQGSADLAAPLYNAVGGQLSVRMRKPAETSGGFIGGSTGSYALKRTFIRLDTGRIGNTGIKAFASFSYRGADQWRGAGTTRRFHTDMRAIKEWADGHTASLIFSFNRQRQYYLRAPTRAQWQANGIAFNYTSTYQPGDANFYKFQENARAQLFLSAPVSLHLSDRFRLTLSPYLIHVRGYDSFGTSLDRTASYNGALPAGPLQVPASSGSTVTAAATDTYTQAHAGLNAALVFTTRHNELSFGYWYSYYDYPNISRYVLADQAGGISNQWGRYPILTSSGVPLTSYDARLFQQVNALSVSERFRTLNDRLTLTAGLRVIMLTRSATNLLPGARYRNGASNVAPLPQLSASYRLSNHDQIYINATTGFRAPSGMSNYQDRFSISTGKQNRVAGTGTKPEYAIGEEIGYRHNGLVTGSVAAFNYNFTNRQVVTTTSLNGAMVTESLNGGGQTARGIQAELGLRPWHGFSPYISGQYIHATIDNNIRSGSDYLPTTGKKAVRTPDFSGALGLAYDNGTIFGIFTGNYVGPTYATFMNDERIPGFATANLSLGYRLHSSGRLHTPQIQLNLINLGRPGYLSGVNGVALNSKATQGVFGTTVAGKAPTYFVGGGFAGVVSLSTGF